MKCILYVLVLFSFFVSSAQVSQKYIGRAGTNQVATEFATLNNGNRVIIGYNIYQGNTNADAVITCLDVNDNILWTREVSTAGNDRFNAITATSDGGCVAVGTIRNGGSNGFVFKFSSAGAVVWSKIIGTSSASEELKAVFEVPVSGNIVCAGIVGGGSGLASLLVDLSSTGTTIWTKAYDATNNDGIRGCTYLNGKIIASGFYVNSFYDGFLLAVNETNGNIVWNRSYDFNSAFYSSFNSVWPTNVYVQGSKLYVDAYLTAGYGGVGVSPTVISFDTTGLNPFCLEYPLTGYGWGNQFHTRIESPTEIYLMQTPNTGNGWDGLDGDISNITSSMKDFVCTKVTSMTANANNIVYSRTSNIAGNQAVQRSHFVNGKLVCIGAAINDPALVNGAIEMFKIEFDPNFPLTSTNCVANITTQQLANPAVSFNGTFSFTNTFTPSFLNNTPAPTINTVTNIITPACTQNIVVMPDTVINKYAAVLSRSSCDNIFTVDDAADFNVGDTILIIQMKGAFIDSANTAAFGSVLDYKGAGNYEYNQIQAKNGNNLTLKYKLARAYQIPSGRVQFVKVPHAVNYTINAPHICMPWTGTKGGVFAINVDNTLTLNNKIDVSAKGFRGGQINNGTTFSCNKTDFFYPFNSNDGGEKGEGITEVSVDKQRGKGRLANGGGGGNNTNAGGGGGGNAALGGFGGHQWINCDTTIGSGGYGGLALGYTPATNKVFLGGGGGTGQENNADTDPAGNGGGLVIIKAATLVGNNNIIRANGANCIDNNALPPANGDGQSGGGAGGTILLNVSTVTSSPFIEAKGGNGGNVYVVGIHGPGGGGAGGAVLLSNNLIPATNVNATGGQNGLIVPLNYAHDAGTGGTGITLNTFLITPAPVTVFQPNTISTNFGDSTISCFSRSFKNLTTTASSGVASVLWDFGGGITSSLASPANTFSGYGTFPVKLVITDSNGCKDSITKSVIILYKHFANAGKDTSACSGIPVGLHATGGVGYVWSPSASISSTNTASTVATPAAYPSTYIVTVTDSISCVDADTVTINLVVSTSIKATPHTASACIGQKLLLTAAVGVKYTWSPGNPLSDSTIANPVAIISGAVTFVVMGTDSAGCSNSDSIIVKLVPGPSIKASPKDTMVCKGEKIQLNATGGLKYNWTPGNILSDSTIDNPLATIPGITKFVVTGTDEKGCINKDSIEVSLRSNPQVTISTPDSDINCTQKSIQLYATGALSYTWHPGIYCNDSLIPSPSVNPVKTTTFTVIGRDFYGCFDTASINVIANYESSVFLPNAFTPDGDGTNDIIKPLTFCGFKLEEFRIFNRWGECVFATNILNSGWDGNFKGQTADMGVYNYFIRGKDDSGNVVLKKGNITLLR